MVHPPIGLNNCNWDTVWFRTLPVRYIHVRFMAIIARLLKNTRKVPRQSAIRKIFEQAES